MSSDTFEHTSSNTRFNRLQSRCSDISMTGKFAIGAFATSLTGLVLGGIAEVAKSDSAEGKIAVGYCALASVGFGVQSIREIRNSRDKRYSKQKNFVQYTHIDEEGSYISPFSVAVTGINKEVLGVGKLIGGLEDDEHDVTPVIAIQDHRSPNGEVELLGSECWWTPLEDEMAEALATDIGQRITWSAYSYKWHLDHQGRSL